MSTLKHMHVILALFSGLAFTSFALSVKPPSVIRILSDDQGHGDISAQGSPIFRTPHLDQVHAESVRFTNFHVDPTCAPTRAALMTGKHASDSAMVR